MSPVLDCTSKKQCASNLPWLFPTSVRLALDGVRVRLSKRPNCANILIELCSCCSSPAGHVQVVLGRNGSVGRHINSTELSSAGMTASVLPSTNTGFSTLRHPQTSRLRRHLISLPSHLQSWMAHPYTRLASSEVSGAPQGYKTLGDVPRPTPLFYTSCQPRRKSRSL
jgi:hypothetical protein